MSPIRKGYYIGYGYMGWVEQLKRYVLFSTESEYEDYILESVEILLK